MNDLEKKIEQARKWSLDPENNIGEAIVTKMGHTLTVSTSCLSGIKILAKFIDGRRVQ